MRQFSALDLEVATAAIEGLAMPAREIFRLHAIEGLDLSEISRRLDLDSGEVERGLAEAIVAIDLALRRQKAP